MRAAQPRQGRRPRPLGSVTKSDVARAIRSSALCPQNPVAATAGARSFKRHLRSPTIRGVLRASVITEAHNGARRKIIDDCCLPETLPGIGEGAFGSGDAGRFSSTGSPDLGAADHGGPALAARMHVAERERVPLELSIPEAVGIGEDEAPGVLAGEFADEGLVGLLPAA